jgi:hypothetical protein
MLMWIFTKHGFFIIVCARRPGNHPASATDENSYCYEIRGRSGLLLEGQVTTAPAQVDYHNSIQLPRNHYCNCCGMQRLQCGEMLLLSKKSKAI